jgi:arylamine N-acetyltransferase
MRIPEKSLHMQAKMPLHTDPHFLITDQATFARFLRAVRIDPHVDRDEALLTRLCAAFACIPYENLTKIIKSGELISPGSAKRFPDEVLRDYLEYGTGGTCFSLTAAFIAIFNALSIEAHPILADRHYGADTHCALVFSHEADLLLLDPGFLINQPVQLPTLEPITLSIGFNTIELVPHDAGRKVELFTLANNSRRSRLTYKVNPLDGASFGRAWERSFTWEMMTYPVLTRYNEGVHQYLQGDLLRIRTEEHTIKQKLTPDEECEFISSTLGIHQTIIQKAFSVIH